MGGWQHTGAFVIQLQPETDVEAGRFSGRVEHVASGRCTHFHSSEQLLAFLDRVLKDACAGLDDRDQRDSHIDRVHRKREDKL